MHTQVLTHLATLRTLIDPLPSPMIRVLFVLLHSAVHARIERLRAPPSPSTASPPAQPGAPPAPVPPSPVDVGFAPLSEAERTAIMFVYGHNPTSSFHTASPLCKRKEIAGRAHKREKQAQHNSLVPLLYGRLGHNTGINEN